MISDRFDSRSFFTAAKLLRNTKAALSFATMAFLIGVSTAGSANAMWKESNDVASMLDNNYTLGTSGTTYTLNYTNQLATNTGASGNYGMYFGWNWVYDTAKTSTALQGNNTTPTFTAPGVVTLTVTRPGFASESIRIGDVVGDTWSGVPFQQFVGDPFITTQDDWVVPLFDFGFMAAGASVNYDITLEFAYASQLEFDRSSQFYVSAQGLQEIPEPGTLALVGASLVGLLVVRRRALQSARI